MEMCQYLIENLTVIYGKGDAAVRAVNNVNIKIHKGEVLAIVGKSGAGKSTILNVLGGLEKCTSGRVLFDGRDMSEYSERKLSDLRLNRIGTVFQGCYLVSTLNVRDNILLPAIASKGQADREYFDELVRRLDISDRLTHMPSQLSGGEKQRVAIARALINKPDVILADEPTGNLDSINGCNVFELLLDCSRECGSTLVYVTHDEEKAELADRKIVMKDGVVIE